MNPLVTIALAIFAAPLVIVVMLAWLWLVETLITSGLRWWRWRR